MFKRKSNRKLIDKKAKEKKRVKIIAHHINFNRFIRYLNRLFLLSLLNELKEFCVRLRQIIYASLCCDHYFIRFLFTPSFVLFLFSLFFVCVLLFRFFLNLQYQPCHQSVRKEKNPFRIFHFFFFDE